MDHSRKKEGSKSSGSIPNESQLNEEPFVIKHRTKEEETAQEQETIETFPPALAVEGNHQQAELKEEQKDTVNVVKSSRKKEEKKEEHGKKENEDGEQQSKKDKNDNNDKQEKGKKDENVVNEAFLEVTEENTDESEQSSIEDENDPQQLPPEAERVFGTS